ncbi:MAG: hypothetical protein WEB00_03205 [Dehalococcoidia bacterium]
MDLEIGDAPEDEGAQRLVILVALLILLAREVGGGDNAGEGEG